MISVLIEHGANTAQQGVLTSAIRSNNDDVANLLLEHGANENVEEMNEALFIMVGRFSGGVQMMPGELVEQNAHIH